MFRQCTKVFGDDDDDDVNENQIRFQFHVKHITVIHGNLIVVGRRTFFGYIQLDHITFENDVYEPLLDILHMMSPEKVSYSHKIIIILTNLCLEAHKMVSKCCTS